MSVRIVNCVLMGVSLIIFTGGWGRVGYCYCMVHTSGHASHRHAKHMTHTLTLAMDFSAESFNTVTISNAVFLSFAGTSVIIIQLM